jgi:tetratricopeptide (TPR) repeat protein
MNPSPFAARMRSKLVLFSIAALLLAAAPSVMAADEGRLSGKVVDTEGNPVAGLTVLFVPDKASGLTTIEHKTNKKGKFTNPAMTSGVYTPDIAERAWVIKQVSLVVRGPDGQKALDITEEVKPGVGVTPLTAQPFMRASLELVVAKAETARPTEAEIATAKDASGLLADLNDLFLQNDWATLIAEAERVIRENPDVGDDLGGAHYLKGIAQWKTDDLDAAANSLRRAYEMIPQQDGIRGTLGSLLLDHARALEAAGDEGGAEESFAEAAEHIGAQLEIEPGSVVYLTNQVIALEGSKQYDAALAGLDELIAADPENPRYFMRKAEILTDQGNPELAVETITQMPGAGESAALVIYNAAVELWNTGNMEGVVAAMDKAIGMAPDMADLYRLKGRALISKGDDTTGIAMLKEYLSRVPEDHPGAEADRALVEALGGGGS